MAATNSVTIVEVGPRDGLQNIKADVPTSTKIKLIERLSRVGLRTIEATSFVSPRWVPQLADAQLVMQGIAAQIREKQIAYPVLVPNIQGFHAAIDSGAKEVSVFVSATEGFSRRNINCTIDEALAKVQPVVVQAQNIHVRVRA
jgi:hydroxymethylglutaryl-CoA lyase